MGPILQGRAYAGATLSIQVLEFPKNLDLELTIGNTKILDLELTTKVVLRLL